MTRPSFLFSLTRGFKQTKTMRRVLASEQIKLLKFKINFFDAAIGSNQW